MITKIGTIINFFLIIDRKSPEIKNTLTLATEHGFIVFRALKNKSKPFVLLLVALNQ